MFWTRVLVAALMPSLLSLPAQAIEFFCQTMDLCSLAPRDAQGELIVNHTDPDLPWVLAGSEQVLLAPGIYPVGIGPIGVPMVFVLQDAVLAIEDTGAMEVGFGAWVILCDRAVLRVRRATWRVMSDFAFEHPLFALGQSRVELEDAAIYALKPEHHATGARGAFFHTMGDASTLVASGVRLPVAAEAWELAVVHQAMADVRWAEVFGEFYVAGQASFSVSDSQYHDLFFEVCPGDDYTLADLPGLCDLNDPVAGCITSSHSPINFEVGPPQTPFHLTLARDKVFSWSVSTYGGSTVRVSGVPALGNFAVGLGGIRENLDLLLKPGAAPVHDGLTDRSLDFDGVHVLCWHVWPVGGSRIRLLPGSEVGDLLPGDRAAGEAEGVTFRLGMLNTPSDTSLRLTRSVVRETITNTGGRMWLVATVLEMPLLVAGPSYLADMPWPGPGALDLRPGGRLHRVEITAPSDGAAVDGPGVVVRGSLRAEESGGPVRPLPPAELVVTAEGGSIPVARVDLDAAGEDALLFDWGTAGLPAGRYLLSLRFAGDGAAAASERTVVIPGEEPNGGPPDGSDGADGSAESDGGSFAPESCGCGARGPGLPLAVLGLLSLGIRRRRVSCQRRGRPVPTSHLGIR